MSDKPLSENPVFGRKVFFINPSLFIENYICEQLKDQEYEVYVISDYKFAKSVLRVHPDSLCFIDIDTEMDFSEWFNFINSFKSDTVLKTVFCGVVSETAKPIDKEKFLMHLSLPGGFINVDKKSVILFDKFKGILDINGAKGRRQYLRLNIKNDMLSGYIASKDKLYSIEIANISSVGMACVFKKNLEDLFPINGVIPNVSITINRRSIVLNCLVLKKLYSETDNVTGVLLFTKDTPSSVKGYIKKFVYEAYEAEMNEILKACVKDNASYKMPAIYKDLQLVCSTHNDEEGFVDDSDSSFGDCETLEEI